RHWRFDEAGGSKLQRFDGKAAHMLIQPRPPCHIHMIARLQQRLHAAGTPAAHHSHMAAMLTGHHFHDGACLAMASCPENYAFIAPFHGHQCYNLGWEIKTHLAIAFRVVTPVLTHFYE